MGHLFLCIPVAAFGLILAIGGCEPVQSKEAAAPTELEILQFSVKESLPIELDGVTYFCLPEGAE